MRSQPSTAFGTPSHATAKSTWPNFVKPMHAIDEPMVVEDDISPFDSVSNWGDEHMDQSFGSSNSSPAKRVNTAYVYMFYVLSNFLKLFFLI